MAESRHEDDIVPVRRQGTASSGTWGEQGNAGAQVDVDSAREAFAELRREFSRPRSGSPSSPKSARRRLTADPSDAAERGQATVASPAQEKPPSSSSGSETTKQGEQVSGTATPKKLEGEDDIEEFDLKKHVENRRQKYEQDGLFFEKNLPIVWKDVTVKGQASASRFVNDLPHAIMGTIFATDFYHTVAGFIPAIKKIVPGQKVQERTLLHGFTGMIRDEMLLVLGRPGSGCSTFLRTIANQRQGFSSITGDVSYGGLSAQETAKKFRGEVTYNPEDDLHFPTLTVGQTLEFAINNKVPRNIPGNDSKKGFSEMFLTTLLKMFSISHTRNTIVGNPFIVGISGGERKRVSIAETLVTKSAVTCWDNSTRGLDSSSALQYGRSLRILTDTCGRGTVVTLYQMSESLYELFDKVLLVDEGRCIYFGTAAGAASYFDKLGFHQTPGQTTADFLTSITDPDEVRYREGAKNVPKTALEREKVWRASEENKQVCADIEAYEEELAETQYESTKNFKAAVRSEKSKAQRKGSIYTISLPSAIWQLTKRQVLLQLGDIQAIKTKTITNISIALVVSSLFYTANKERSTASAFTRGGVLFFSCLFLAWLNLAEIYGAMSGRPVIQRHKQYAFYRPGAVSIARVLADLPFTAFQVTVFSVVTYFLSSLRYDASAFFIYYLFVLTSCYSVTALYRAVAAISGSFDTAIRFSVMYLTFAVVFAGYILPREAMPPYFRWISYVQPISFAFEALMGNEFTALDLACSPAQLQPNIPGADPRYQSCAFAGSRPGSLTVNGNDYLRVSFGYYRSNLWHNFGYMLAYFVVYLTFDALASEFLSFVPDGAAALVFARTKHAKQAAAKREAKVNSDEEESVGYKGGKAAERATSRASAVDEHKPNPPPGCEDRPIFTWKNVKYAVPGPEGPIPLLRNVSGWVKPGEVTALMGASGAGKTTLLNTLAGRQPPMMVEGDILVDGKPLTKGFKREAGFAEQQDIHETSATVREALEFAALLRQPYETPREEKLAHVERIMDLLDLRYLEDALIGEPGAGLTVEQRKRVTIGVELAAKPSLLMFLDEPTSGLDSSGAYQVGTFLRRLANDGQTVLCTIHQPSALLFTTFFDNLLLLAPGGRTAFFGKRSNIVPYFKDHGARPYEDHENIAEYILEIVGGPAPKGHASWADVWDSSKEYKAMHEEIDRISNERKPRPPATDPNKEREYAATWREQTTLLTIRMAKNFWRDASYGYGKIWTVIILGLVNGFTFFKVEATVAGLQQIVFSVLLLLFTVPAFANASIIKHFTLKSLWQAREGPSKTYSSMAFVTALLINETPYALACAVLYWITWYLPSGLRRGEGAGYTFLATVLYYLFLSPWIHWLCSMAYSPTFVANVLPFFLVVLTIMNGVIVPWSAMPVIWKYWVYWMNPNTYLVRGMVSQVLHNVPVRCTEQEFAIFNPPPGQSCGQYVGDYATQNQGSIDNPDDTALCRYCPYTTGDQFTASLNGNYYHSWYEDLIIYAMFTACNVLLCYVLFYVFQIKGYAAIWEKNPFSPILNLFKKKPKEGSQEEEKKE